MREVCHKLSVVARGLSEVVRDCQEDCYGVCQGAVATGLSCMVLSYLASCPAFGLSPRTELGAGATVEGRRAGIVVRVLSGCCQGVAHVKGLSRVVRRVVKNVSGVVQVMKTQKAGELELMSGMSGVTG